VQVPLSQYWPWGQSALLEHAQNPKVHALPLAHAAPHAPQFFASLDTSSHVPPQQKPLAHWSAPVHAEPTGCWARQVPGLPGLWQ